MTRPSQENIARMLGVSRAAVTQALQGTGRLSPEMRSRIQAAAQQMGYQTNAASTAILTGQFGSVGLLMGTDQQASVISQETLWGIEDALETRGWHLIIQRLRDEELAPGDGLPKALRVAMVDGLIVNYTHHVPPAAAARLRSMPTVWINTKSAEICIHPDDHGAALAGTRRLLAAGHRRIAYTDFEGPERHPHYSNQDRWDGYATAMREAGLMPQRVLGDQKIPVHGRVTAAQELLRRPQRPTAIVCWNSELCALPLVAAARMLGLDVPLDLQIFTFGDHAVHLLDCPILCAVLPQHEIGLHAVDLLARRIAGKPCPPISPVPLEIIGTASRPR